MGPIRIYAGAYTIVVPFNKMGLEICRAFLDLLADLLEAEGAGGR